MILVAKQVDTRILVSIDLNDEDLKTFCPTGQGGGVDPSCGGEGGAPQPSLAQLEREIFSDKNDKQRRRLAETAHESSKLSEDEKMALVRYKKTTSVNRFLRRGEEGPEKIKQQIASLDSAISKGKTTEDVVVYRGINKKFRKGEYKNAGFVSVSTAVAQARYFAGEKTIIRMVLKKGTQSGSVDAVSDSDMKEGELLLPRGGTIRVTRIEEVSRPPEEGWTERFQIAHAEWVPPPRRTSKKKAFCPTGPGGGVDSSCGSGGGGASKPAGGGKEIPKPPKVPAVLQPKYDEIHAAAQRGDRAAIEAVKTNPNATSPYPKKLNQYKTDVLAAMGGGASVAKPAAASSSTADKPAAAATQQAGGKPTKVSQAKVGYAESYAIEATDRAFNRVVGAKRAKDPEFVASIVGAPDNAKVSKIVSFKGRPVINIKHPDFDASRTLYKDKDGKKVIENTEFFMKKSAQGKGIGTQVFTDQVNYAKANGFDYIKCHAARESPKPPPFNGYYTWARMGYDQSLTPKVVAVGQAHIWKATREKFPEAKTVLDVMSTKEGRDYWKANGADMMDARFDLTPGSRSLKVLEAYEAERKARAS